MKASNRIMFLLGAVITAGLLGCTVYDDEDPDTVVTPDKPDVVITPPAGDNNP